MAEQLKINKLEIENTKRVKAVKIEPTANGLTVIGGKNGQGKTSVLNAIAWALGGNKYRPSEPYREGSMTPPNLHIVMNNGLIVERTGKNGTLKVIDPKGNKSGQQLLDSFVEELAINLPKFIESSSKEKANTLLQIIGVGDQLMALEQEEKEIYNQRHAIGVIADQKAKFAKEQPYYTDAPKDLVSASDLISQQQEILARNGRNQQLRNQLSQIITEREKVLKETTLLVNQIDEMKTKLEAKQAEYQKLTNDAETAEKSVSQLVDESTAELENNINQIDEINAKVRANFNKNKAEEDAAEYRDQYDTLTTKITEVRQKKTDLLNNAELPLEGLSVSDGELIYNGHKWDGMSGSEQLKVATAIVRKLNPKCGFVLLDKLEQMDIDTMTEFGQWLEREGLQAIATRVSTGDECSIVIEDGYVKGQEMQMINEPVEPEPEPVQAPAGKWNF